MISISIFLNIYLLFYYLLLCFLCIGIIENPAVSLCLLFIYSRHGQPLGNFADTP